MATIAALRSAATLLLSASVGMVLAGESLLRDQLRAEAFVYYWLACIVLAFLAMATALVDFWLVRRAVRRQQKRLMADILKAFTDAGIQIDLRDVRDF